jgi:hypothetical protein
MRTHAEIVSDLNLMTTNTVQDVTGNKHFITRGEVIIPRIHYRSGLMTIQIRHLAFIKAEAMQRSWYLTVVHLASVTAMILIVCRLLHQSL